MNLRESVELFHLIFLHNFSERVERNLYSLKGGRNLRFFFKSIRYSEDIDLDIHTVAADTLRNHVRKVLKSKSFIDGLSTSGIFLERFSEPKQTDTVQRWKFLIKHNSSAQEIPTKLEFSRRAQKIPSEFGVIEDEIQKSYRLFPIAISHYGLEDASKQKILALANRGQTQTRDVFDLAHLIGFSGSKNFLENLTNREIAAALDNLQSLNFQDYQSQVLEYLPEKYRELYGAEQAWVKMVEKVREFLS